MDLPSRRSIIGSPPIRDGDRVKTKKGVGVVTKSVRTPKGICLYEVKFRSGHVDVFDLSAAQIL